VLGDDPRSHDRRKIFSVTPVPSASDPEGYLYVVLRGEQYDAAERMAREGHFIEMSASAVALSLAFGLVAGLLAFHLLTRRLSWLTRLVEQFESGDMSQRPPRPWSQLRPVVRDEIDYLGATFDRMAQRIASQIEELREKDVLRRRLVAQVSHDLRTPLAAMQGYVESLRLKQDSLSTQEQTQFLDIALKEGRRLGRLVDELFELAALDAREKDAEPEPFAPAELVYDVVQKHEPAARPKQIRLAVEAAADEGMEGLPLVYGDLGMTERALDNLISNAITHSPVGGLVVLTLGKVDGWLEIRVTDSGPGIDPAESERLFDPLYRGSAPDERGHAGLGLAIARRIMELQGGDIRVIDRSDDPVGDSRANGASFLIRLPLAQR
jgi:signal transduction histidine kinase